MRRYRITLGGWLGRWLSFAVEITREDPAPAFEGRAVAEAALADVDDERPRHELYAPARREPGRLDGGQL